jgi:hypothetical protein
MDDEPKPPTESHSAAWGDAWQPVEPPDASDWPTSNPVLTVLLMVILAFACGPICRLAVGSWPMLLAVCLIVQVFLTSRLAASIGCALAAAACFGTMSVSLMSTIG